MTPTTAEILSYTCKNHNNLKNGVGGDHNDL